MTLPPIEEFSTQLTRRVMANFRPPFPAHSVLSALLSAGYDLYQTELQRVPEYKSSPDPQSSEALAIITGIIEEYILAFVKEMPSVAFQSFEDFEKATNAALNDEPLPETFSVPLIDMLKSPGESILNACLPFYSDLQRYEVFTELKDQIDKNLHDVSEVPFTPLSRNTGKLTLPNQFKGSGRDAIVAYLTNTPLLAPYLTPIPFKIPDSIRSEHTHIIGPSGSGKTHLIQQMILDDLKKPDPPAMVIIDPKGLMIERLSKLDVFHPEEGRLKDRLIIIDPINSPPALNVFDSGPLRHRMWSDAITTQVEAQTASTFGYIFSSTDYSLTAKMTVPFSNAVRLLFLMDGATIEDMFDLLEEKSLAGSRFEPFVGRLDTTAQRFFRNDFFSSEYTETKRQIKGRLYSLLGKAPIQKMLYAKTRRVDLVTCLEDKKIVLVNTAMTALTEQHQLIGRYFIASTLNAAFARVAIPKEKWDLAHLYIDEFGEFADEVQTPRLFRLAREYNLGCTIAHHSMHDDTMKESLRATISTSTSVKYAGKPEGVDKNYVARDLATTPEYLDAIRKTDTHAHFACFVRNYLDRPVMVSIPFGNVEKQPQMPTKAHKAMLARNAEALTEKPAEAKPARPLKDISAPAHDDDMHSKPSLKKKKP